MSGGGEPVFTGGCLCGAIRYEARGQPRGVNHCHCTQCQRASGGAMATWATWLASDIKILQGKITEFASSPGARRGFCQHCGSTLSWRGLNQTPAELDIAAGTLDDPDPLAPVDHIFTKSRRRWLPLCDGLPAYREHRPKG